jgi:hypothetical protein
MAPEPVEPLAPADQDRTVFQSVGILRRGKALSLPLVVTRRTPLEPQENSPGPPPTHSWGTSVCNPLKHEGERWACHTRRIDDDDEPGRGGTVTYAR